MSESTESHNQIHGQPISYASGVTARRTSLVQIGGAMGIAACLIGMAIFFGACAGFNAVFALSVIPLALSAPGLIVTLIGGFCQKSVQIEDTAALSAMFVNVAGIVGALVEIAVWRNWTLLPH